MVVEDFVVNAKKECDKVFIQGISESTVGSQLICQIMMSRNLSRQPFTNSVLREMAINFTKGNPMSFHYGIRF